MEPVQHHGNYAELLGRYDDFYCDYVEVYGSYVELLDTCGN